MKVAIISSSYHPYILGGGEKSAQLLAESLHQRGLQVFVITAFEEDTVEMINGIKVYRVKHPNLYWSYHASRMPDYKKILWHTIESYNLRTKRKIVPILKQEKPDMVQVRNYQDFSSLLWKIVYDLGIPLVQTLNDYASLCYKATMYRNAHNCVERCRDCRMVTWPRKSLSRYVSAVVGVSRYTLQEHTRRGYFPHARKEVIHTTPFLSSYENVLKSGQVTFGMIGRIHPSKGIAEAIDAFQKADAGQNKLIIAGEGPEDYMKVCREKAAGNTRIQFLGKTNAHDFYNTIDVLIIPSLWHEPFPRVLIEAYAYGRPVIASNRGGTAEQITAGKTGFVFDADHFEQLSRLIERVSKKPQEVMQMHQSVINFVEHQQKNDVEMYIDLYKALI